MGTETPYIEFAVPVNKLCRWRKTSRAEMRVFIFLVIEPDRSAIKIISRRQLVDERMGEKEDPKDSMNAFLFSSLRLRSRTAIDSDNDPGLT
jgi:hypothetical protein